MLRKMSVKKKKTHIFSGQLWPFCYELLKDPVGLHDDVSLIIFFHQTVEKVFHNISLEEV